MQRQPRESIDLIDDKIDIASIKHLDPKIMLPISQCQSMYMQDKHLRKMWFLNFTIK